MNIQELKTKTSEHLINQAEELGIENASTLRKQEILFAILKKVAEKEEITGEEGAIITNQTPFYGESGGQLGDKGTIVSGNSIFEVEDTQKKLGDLFVHYGSLKIGEIKINDIVEMKIDVKRRENLKAYHSATHLLHESLRRTLGKHVMQKGSLVAPDRLRFDFSHMKPITNEELETIDKLVNEYVSNSSEVTTRIMTPKAAIEKGALAFFGEKYGEEVRVVSMGKEKETYFSTELCGGTHVKNNTEVTTRIMTPKAAIEKGALAFFGEKYGEEVRVVSMGKEKEAYFSTELCGGTHVKNTSDIGKFKTVSQSSIAAGVRRVEALRDKQLDEYIKNQNT